MIYRNVREKEWTDAALADSRKTYESFGGLFEIRRRFPKVTVVANVT